MFNNIYAWYELIKLGNISKVRQDIDSFYRGNVIRVLATEGWLNFLKDPKTLKEIMNQFQYTDQTFLELILRALVNDKTMKIVENNKYVFNQPVNTGWVLPTIFDEQMKDLWWNFSDFIPERLKGNYYNFSGGFNLFNWDNVLSNKMYSQIRKSAFSYASGLKKEGSFLDVGSGNGYGTTSIWCLFKDKFPQNRVKIVGLEQDDNLLSIAKDEFERMAKNISGKSLDELRKNKNDYPEYVKGNVLEIPYQDNTFDFTYASQVLHWTDAKTALKEMIRVTKKGGIIFGTQNFYPKANEFNDIHFKVIKGAEGFFTKNDMTKWVKDCGARKVKYSTPISIFKIVK